MKHSPEPWIIGEPRPGSSGGTVVSIGVRPHYCGEVDYNDETDIANAERIVACVNYCQGIPTKELTTTLQGIQGDLKDAIALLRTEIRVTNLLLTDRERLLDAIPECPAHGQCVTYALEWVEKQRHPWRPVSTAPRNGTRILMSCGPSLYDGPTTGQVWADTAFDDSGTVFHRLPTHWMPIPELPENTP